MHSLHSKGHLQGEFLCRPFAQFIYALWFARILIQLSCKEYTVKLYFERFKNEKNASSLLACFIKWYGTERRRKNDEQKTQKRLNYQQNTRCSENKNENSWYEIFAYALICKISGCIFPSKVLEIFLSYRIVAEDISAYPPGSKLNVCYYFRKIK